jgi:hypothetical protein
MKQGKGFFPSTKSTAPTKGKPFMPGQPSTTPKMLPPVPAKMGGVPKGGKFAPAQKSAKGPPPQPQRGAKMPPPGAKAAGPQKGVNPFKKAKGF